jgi:hypothetical protein
MTQLKKSMTVPLCNIFPFRFTRLSVNRASDVAVNISWKVQVKVSPEHETMKVHLFSPEYHAHTTAKEYKGKGTYTS